MLLCVLTKIEKFKCLYITSVINHINLVYLQSTTNHFTMSNFCAKITTNSGRTVHICSESMFETDGNVGVLYYAFGRDYVANCVYTSQNFKSTFPSEVLAHIMEIDSTLPPIYPEEMELLKIADTEEPFKYSYFIDGTKLSKTKSLLKELLSAVETEYRVIYMDTKSTHILTDSHWYDEIKNNVELLRDHTNLQATIIVDDKNNRKVSLIFNPHYKPCFEIMLINLNHPIAIIDEDRLCKVFPLNSEDLLEFIRELQPHSDQKKHNDW